MYQRPGFSFPPLQDTPGVMGLILGSALVFLLHFVAQAVGVKDPIPETWSWAISVEWFRSLQVWQPLTYPFVHTDFLGLLIDGLILYFFAGSLERAWGMLRFLLFFFLSSILAGLVLLAFVANLPVAPVLAGLGAGIWLTMIVGFATLNPYATIWVMMVLPIQARWLAWITIAFAVFQGYGLYGGPIQAIASVAVLAAFAYVFTSRDFRASFVKRGPKGPSFRERFDRWQQRRRMRQWQRRVSKIERPEDLFKKDR